MILILKMTINKPILRPKAAWLQMRNYLTNKSPIQLTFKPTKILINFSKMKD